MHAIRLLLKTTAGTTLKVHVHGGKPLFDAADAAHALAGLNPVLSSIAYYRFCGDDGQYNKVKGNLFIKALRICNENNYKIKNTTLAGLCDAALKQVSMPICLKCDGMAVMRVPGQEEPHVCRYCVGTGQQQLTLKAIGECLGVKRQSILKSHLNVYHQLVEYVQKSERTIIDHVARNIDP